MLEAPWQASKDSDGMVWAGSDANLTAMGRYDFFAQTQTQARARTGAYGLAAHVQVSVKPLKHPVV